MRKYFIVCLLTVQTVMMMSMDSSPTESIAIQDKKNTRKIKTTAPMAKAVLKNQLRSIAGSGEFSIEPQQPESPSEIFSSNSWCEQSCSPDLREWRTESNSFK